MSQKLIGESGCRPTPYQKADHAALGQPPPGINDRCQKERMLHRTQNKNITVIPRSHEGQPGHSILEEDMSVLQGWVGEMMR